MTFDSTRRRWLALIVLCMGNLMIVLDATIVNVALPSIRSDLGFSESSLAWVVNAYLLTFGGCLQEGAKGRIARMIIRNGKGGDFRDFPEIEAWAARVADELVEGTKAT